MSCPRCQALLVALALLLAACSSSVDAAGSPEASLLLQFKASISDTTGALKSWEAGTPPCGDKSSTWAGVICDDQGHVSGLRLEDMHLSGSLSRVGLLTGLPALRTLSFSRNNLEGPMPEVGKLKSLRAVFLSMNKFSGEIPANAFEGMSSLKKLYLSRNDFSGPIPASIARLPRLLDLGLDENKFSGGIPELQSQHLKVLDLSGNHLEGPIPASLRKVDPSAFADNKGLCGEPLQTECQSPPTPAPAPSTKPTGGKGSRVGQPPFFLITVAIFIFASICLLVLFSICRKRRPEDEQCLSANPNQGDNLKKLEEGRGGINRTASAGGKSAASTNHRTELQHGLVFLRQEGPRFQLPDLLRSEAEVIGSGDQFGSAYKASLPSGHCMLVRRFREMNRVGKEDFEEHMRRLGRLSHPNLLPLLAYYFRKDEKLLVANFANKRSLSDALHGYRAASLPALDWPTRLKIIRGIAKGLNYLYEELQMLSIPHGQLKSSNIYLDDSFEPLLADYALLPVVNQASAQQSMVAYRTPEFKQDGKTSKKSDVWCLGILILEILTGGIPATDAQRGQEGSELQDWVNSILEEEWSSEVIDREMRGKEGREEEVVKLLKIALASCEENVEKRYRLERVLDEIDELKEEE